MKRYTRRTPEQWKSLVSEQQKSELSAPQFCRQFDIAYASFSKWKNRIVNDKFDKPEALPAFVEIEPKASMRKNWAVQLDFGTGMVLRIASS